MSSHILLDIVGQHAEEASFLWLLRTNATGDPRSTLSRLGQHDERVEAHIDGLRIAGDAGWDVCKQALQEGDAGEAFAAAVLAFESNEEGRIRVVRETCDAKPDLCQGVISALGWLSWQQVEPYVDMLLGDDSLPWRYVGLAASAAHRRDPGRVLTDALKDADSALRARALRTAGELGHPDFLPLLKQQFEDDDEACRFWAAWSASLLGEPTSVELLISFAQNRCFGERAVSLAVRLMDQQTAIDRLEELSQKLGLVRLSVQGLGAIGDPRMVPFLIELMAIPDVARVAGESLSMITGVNIADVKLETQPPAFSKSVDEEDLEESGTNDPDENLSWPNPDLIAAWWEENNGRFISGTRYLCGQPITESHLQHVLRSGYQRQRHAAALELAMMIPGQPLFNVCAPAWRQKQLLGMK
ncbi:hypothetical protein OR1_01677 [Geobacter sp. OR-1]|uniref:TIGR02270 family protein n=1 Tax=Geobacter sp. OR-1 TaxID=1266765 RepID=UPI0005422B2A|nr:TIGR02270 family protein [Geobacter sp. OR-1]GAM09399.1 hypothetical protein OR1_01677 [Geobacter sp. OR-1]